MHFTKYLLNHTENWTLYISTFRQLTRDTRGEHKLSWISRGSKSLFRMEVGECEEGFIWEREFGLEIEGKQNNEIDVSAHCRSEGREGRQDHSATQLWGCNCRGCEQGPLRCLVPAYMATCTNLEGRTFQAKKYKMKTKWLKKDQYQIKP